jgi:hypothetical protein
MTRRMLPALAGLSVLLSVIWLGLSYRAVHAQVSMNITGLPEKGLHLVGTGDPGFGRLLKSLPGDETTPELDALRPYSVILQNKSLQTVVAYVLRWEYTNLDGKRIHMDLSDGEITRLMDGPTRKVPTEYDENGPALDPHSWVLATPSTVLKTSSGARDRANDPNYQAFLQRIVTRFNQGQDFSVTLDGAFFEDGSFVGPNRSHLFENFSSEVSARQNLVQQIVDAAQAGRSVNEVAREIQASLPDSPPKLTRASDGTIRGDDQYYRHKYASRFLSVYRNAGQESALEWAKNLRFQNVPRLTTQDSKKVEP